MGPSLVRGSSVVRGFDGQNISSQKLCTREVLLYRNHRWVVVVWDPTYLKRLVKPSSLLVNCYPVNKFHKKFRLHSRKINVVRCAWTIECLLGSENL